VSGGLRVKITGQYEEERKLYITMFIAEPSGMLFNNCNNLLYSD